MKNQMCSRLIPADAHRAARRGFVRTACQSLASVIPTSAIGVIVTREWIEGMVLGIVGALLTALLAGAASYLSILAEGIPADYRQDTECGNVDCPNIDYPAIPRPQDGGDNDGLAR